MRVDARFCVFFITEVSLYSFYDLYGKKPMRHIEDEEIICYTRDYSQATVVVDALNSNGEI